MTYGRIAILKPEQETAISNFALRKDKITGSRFFLNHCEELILLVMKQGCSAIDWSTHATTNARKQMNSHLVNFFSFYKI